MVPASSATRQGKLSRPKRSGSRNKSRSTGGLPSVNVACNGSQPMIYTPTVVPSGCKKTSQLARRQKRLVTLRLVREGSFLAPEGYPVPAPMYSPRNVYEYMAPYAAREVCESFWILPLDSQHQVARAGPAVITRGILEVIS